MKKLVVLLAGLALLGGCAEPAQEAGVSTEVEIAAVGEPAEAPVEVEPLVSEVPVPEVQMGQRDPFEMPEALGFTGPVPVATPEPPHDTGTGAGTPTATVRPQPETPSAPPWTVTGIVQGLLGPAAIVQEDGTIAVLRPGDRLPEGWQVLAIEGRRVWLGDGTHRVALVMTAP